MRDKPANGETHTRSILILRGVLLPAVIVIVTVVAVVAVVVRLLMVGVPVTAVAGVVIAGLVIITVVMFSLATPIDVNTEVAVWIRALAPHVVGPLTSRTSVPSVNLLAILGNPSLRFPR